MERKSRRQKRRTKIYFYATIDWKLLQACWNKASRWFLKYLRFMRVLFLCWNFAVKGTEKSISWSRFPLIGNSLDSLHIISTTLRNLLDTASIVYKSIAEIKFALRSHGRHEALWPTNTSISSAQSFVSLFWKMPNGECGNSISLLMRNEGFLKRC